MRHLGVLIISLSLSILSVSAQEYVVVTQKKMSALNRFQVKAIFLKKMEYLDGVHLIAVNLSPDNKMRQSFEKHCLQMGRARLKQYWTKAHYLGHRPPLRKASIESVTVFLRRVEGSVSYLPIEAVDSSFSILYRWSD